MRRTNAISFRFALAGLLLAVSFAANPAQSQPAGVTLFEGARLITGDGGVIADSAFIVAGNQFGQVGRKGEVALPQGATRVDLTGKTVMPALVDAHVHMGYRKGLDFSQNNYTRANLTDILDRFAYYGVAAILEAGTSRSDLVYEIRANPPPGAPFPTPRRASPLPTPAPPRPTPH